jgi:hypothetical protein
MAPPQQPRHTPQMDQIVSVHVGWDPPVQRPACTLIPRQPPRPPTPPKKNSKRPKSAEFFALTYGAIVRQLIMDYEDLDQVNKQLDTM